MAQNPDLNAEGRELRAEAGIAVVICLLAMSLLLALGSGLILTSSVDLLIAGNFRAVREDRFAAEGALELAIGDLPQAAWSDVLNGTVHSAFTDGPPSGDRTLADGSTLNLPRLVNLANCGKTTSCTANQMNAVTVARPWGVDNPRWQLYAYGQLRDLVPGGAIVSADYVTVLVADDQGENDGDPLVDGAEPGNPGRGVIVLRAEAFGPRGRRHGVEATVAQTPGGARIRSWRAIAQLDAP